MSVTAVAPVDEFDDIQRQVLATYQEGIFSHITTKKELAECGDGFVRYLVTELSHAEDCTHTGTALDRIDALIRDISDMRIGFFEKHVQPIV